MKIEVTHKLQVLALVALVALGGLAYALSFVPLGAAAMPIALAVSALKAAIIVLVFMELVEERLSSALTLFTAVTFIALVTSIVAIDLVSRDPPGIAPPFEGALGAGADASGDVGGQKEARP